MAKIITCGMEKGGTAKTTTCGVLAWLLSGKNKVLVIDMDGQGSLTELICGDIEDFAEHNIFNAIQKRTPEGNIVAINDNLHILAGTPNMALFPRWLNDYESDKSLAVGQVIKSVADKYDFILIDTPPNLGDATLNALAACHYVICTYEPSKYCYSALGRFLETIEAIKQGVNPDIKVAGIVINLVDTNRRRLDTKAMIELVEEEYPGLSFKTMIYRKAAIGRLVINGFTDNPEFKKAISPFKPLLEEVLQRCR